MATVPPSSSGPVGGQVMQQPAAADASQGYAKAIISSMAGAAVTLVVVVYDQYAPHPLPAEAISALQVLVMGAATLFTPHNLFGGK